MPRLVSFLLIALFLNNWAGNERFLQEKGTRVARQAQDRDTGRDGRVPERVRRIAGNETQDSFMGSDFFKGK